MEKQPTTNEIIENNRLIAEFMGLNLLKDTKHFREEYKDDEDLDRLYCINENQSNWYSKYVEDLEYCSNWNWLMRVVERIESLSFNGRKVWTTIKTFNTSREKNYHEMKLRVYDSEYSDGKYLLEYDSDWFDSKIEAVYNTCIEFIKWYNSNKNTPKPIHYHMEKVLKDREYISDLYGKGRVSPSSKEWCISSKSGNYTALSYDEEHEYNHDLSILLEAKKSLTDEI